MGNNGDFDEFDDAEPDAIIAELFEMAEYYGDVPEPKEVSPDKVERVRQLSEIVGTIMRGDKLRVRFIDDMFPSSRGIGITGNNVYTANTEALGLILRTATTVEISPRTDGRADFGMTFGHLDRNVYPEHDRYFADGDERQTVAVAICYQAVTLLTDEVTRKNRGTMQEDAKRKTELWEICQSLDEIGHLFESTGCECQVDETTHDITVSLVCPWIEATSKDEKYKAFFDMVEKSKRFGFGDATRDGEEGVHIDFAFSGIWTGMSQV